jgi:DNA topoisomerase IB
MVILDILFDVLSASVGAIMGAVFAFYLNKKRNKKMANQIIFSRQELEKIKLENQSLLDTIREKENLILKMQLEILGKQARKKKK